VRVIVDPADRAVPPAELLGMAPGGSTDVSAMLWDILARPSQLSLLIRLAADGLAARVAVVRLRRALGPSFSYDLKARSAYSKPEPKEYGGTLPTNLPVVIMVYGTINEFLSSYMCIAPDLVGILCRSPNPEGLRRPADPFQRASLFFF
jgi:hypothetical protein